MTSRNLYHLHSGWHVDQAIVTEHEKLVVIRFGNDNSREAMLMDNLLLSVSEKVSNFVSIYLVDIEEVTDFNEMYELTDPMCLMFFYQNKHMMCDFGTGNNNKLNFVIDDKQELIDIFEVIFRGARKNKGLVVSPYDYSDQRVD